MNNSIISIADRLADSIRAKKLGLRALLTQQKGSRRIVKDKDIHNALYDATEDGSVESCRILWEALSPYGKQKYFAKKGTRAVRLIQWAVEEKHFAIVRLFMEEFKWNINQKNNDTEKTPLCSAVHNLEMARFLLENGANVNQGDPLWCAVQANNTEVCHLLLVEYQADPNLHQPPSDPREIKRNTDWAIAKENPEILRMLVECGAFVGNLNCKITSSTSLTDLLEYGSRTTSRETKLAICRILIAHAKNDIATADFMQATFKQVIGHIESCEILIEASTSMLYRAVERMTWPYGQADIITICRLLVQYGADPFAEEEGQDENGKWHNTSPFVAAARLADTTILEYFLGLWDARFASTGGKNSDGDYPIHVVCCDSQVSLQTIQLLVKRQADAVSKLDGEQGLYPFHFAAMWDASLDVIFYLLQHCPGALLSLRHHHHVGNNAAALPAAVVDETSSSLAAASAAKMVENPPESNSDCNGPLKKKAEMTRH